MAVPLTERCLASRELVVPDLAAVDVLGAAIAARLRPGDAVLLEGELGAGKTALARAVLRAMAADPALEVPSPSYTLVQSYDTPAGPVHHFDLWRLDGPAGLEELGWEEARAQIVLVEWPDRLGPFAPADALRVRLDPGRAEQRLVQLAGWNGWRP